MPTDRFANVVAAASTRSFDYASRKNLLLRPTGGDSPAAAFIHSRKVSISLDLSPLSLSMRDR
eukprot:1059289-Prymnesium_polylepis.1